MMRYGRRRWLMRIAYALAALAMLVKSAWDYGATEG
jgi:hypothetical protein